MAITSIPGSWFNKYRGLSTDPKPYTYVPNGSEFMELDTGKEFKFDAQNRKWIPWSQASGGSGGSGSGQAQGGGTTASIALSGVWSGNDPYTQTVTVTGYTVTANTRADIMADDSVVDQMVADGVDTIYIENDNGVLTAYAVGGKPSGAYNITVVLSEV